MSMKSFRVFCYNLIFGWAGTTVIASAITLSARAATTDSRYATDGDATAGFIWLAVILGCYFLPWIVACCRRHKNALAIFWLNLFTGWTFIGWVGALVWACTSHVKAPLHYTDNRVLPSRGDPRWKNLRSV